MPPEDTVYSSRPVCSLRFTLSGSLFAITDFLLPDSASALKHVLTRRLDNAGQKSDLVQKFSFQNDKDRRNWQAASFDKVKWVLNRASVEWNLNDGRTRTILAKKAYRTNDVWRFEEVTHWIKKSPDDTPPVFRENFLEFPEFDEDPEIFLKEIQFKSFRKDQLIKKSRFPLVDILEYLEYKTDLDDEESDISTKASIAL